MCTNQTRKVISKRMENVCVCVRVCRSLMLVCSHHFFFFLFFVVRRFAFQSSFLATATAAVLMVAAAATAPTTALRRFTPSDETRFFYFLSAIQRVQRRAHIHVRRVPCTISTIHITVSYRIVSYSYHHANGFKTQFVFCAESFFPLALLLRCCFFSAAISCTVSLY